MTAQSNLSAFLGKTVSTNESTLGFRPWNKTILDWEIEYQGYSRGDDEGPPGYIDFHVIVEIKEAMVWAKDQNKKYKKGVCSAGPFSLRQDHKIKRS